jgi:hypothetical protein
MANPTIRFKRGTQSAFASVGLQTGEPAFITDQFNFYVGIDGNSANNKFFGSSRYWNKETDSVGSSLRLVEGLTNGSNYVEIKAPNNIGSNITYTLPGTQGGNQTVLTNDGSGNLSWSSGSLNAVFSGITTIGGDFLDVNVNSDFSGITTFSNTTDNTLGNANTGAVQIDGGLGVNKNVTVGAGLSVIDQSYFIGTATFYNNTVFTNSTDNNLGNYNTGAVQIDGGLGVQKNLTVGAGLSVAGESYFIGTATFYGGQINLGDSDGDNISVAGEFVSNLVPNATNTYDLGLVGKRWRDGYFSRNLEVTGNLTVDGNVTIGGTSVTLLGQDVFIKNKDIVLGYTTSVTNTDASTDDTANHAGVAIASTVGSPLVSFVASGINTLPDTYKQLMWFKQGTLGFGTDAFGFNYGVAIGTTTMANGVRLAVGTGVTVSDTSVSATNFYGSLSGNASSANQVKTVTASNNNATYHITFVDANNGSATNETVYTDDGIYYNPGTNTLTVGTGVGITQFSSSVSTGSSTSSVPTSSAIIDYVDSEIGAIDLTLGLNADAGGPSTVNTSQTLTINGTASEVNTSVSGQTVTIGLPDDVVVGTSLSAPTLRTGTIQSSNTGATAITIAANDVTIADDLTVQGNLYVNGNTTQVNTTAITVEDRTIELGVVDGSAPSSSTTWDLGVLFNYNSSGAKKSAVIWEHGDNRFKFASVLASDTNGSDVNTPQLTVTTFAPIEVAELWVNNACTGGSDVVIGCSGGELQLQNVVVDGGSF